MIKIKNIGVLADTQAKAKKACDVLLSKYDLIKLTGSEDKKTLKAKDINVIIALGGDGFMLHTMHNYMNLGVHIYGMNCGTVGFLLNSYSEKDLLEKISSARTTFIHPLKMTATTEDGIIYEEFAMNEVSLLRNSGQAAHIRISVDNTVHMKNLICDGILIATAAGSSAYNFSIGGPILPLRSNLLALTPISPFRPRRWRGALLSSEVKVRFDILHNKKRSVNATADFWDVNNVVSVEVCEDKAQKIELMFNPGHSLEERILKEQFAS